MKQNLLNYTGVPNAADTYTKLGYEVIDVIESPITYHNFVSVVSTILAGILLDQDKREVRKTYMLDVDNKYYAPIKAMLDAANQYVRTVKFVEGIAETQRTFPTRNEYPAKGILYDHNNLVVINATRYELDLDIDTNIDPQQLSLPLSMPWQLLTFSNLPSYLGKLELYLKFYRNNVYNEAITLEMYLDRIVRLFYALYLNGNKTKDGKRIGILMANDRSEGTYISELLFAMLPDFEPYYANTSNTSFVITGIGQGKKRIHDACILTEDQFYDLPEGAGKIMPDQCTKMLAVSYGLGYNINKDPGLEDQDLWTKKSEQYGLEIGSTALAIAVTSYLKSLSEGYDEAVSDVIAYALSRTYNYNGSVESMSLSQAVDHEVKQKMVEYDRCISQKVYEECKMYRDWYRKCVSDSDVSCNIGNV